MRGVSWLAAEQVSFSRSTLLHGVSKVTHITLNNIFHVFFLFFVSHTFLVSRPSPLAPCSALLGGGWSTPRPGRFTPGKEIRYPLYRSLDGPQCRSGGVRKISPPPEFDPRTFQPVARRYTDWAIAAPYLQHVQQEIWISTAVYKRNVNATVATCELPHFAYA